MGNLFCLLIKFYYGEAPFLKLTDHALVFMAQGMSRRWKQPLAFMFRNKSIPAQQLGVLIKHIASHLIKCGFKQVAAI